MLVINESLDKGFFFEEGGNYIFDYGLLKKGDNTDININISDGYNISNIQVTSSCGCTVPKILIADKKNFNLEISYNSNLLGHFYKKITAKFKSENQLKSVIINIKGVVETTN
jgi:hypothetical protein